MIFLQLLILALLQISSPNAWPYALPAPLRVRADLMMIIMLEVEIIMALLPPSFTLILSKNWTFSVEDGFVHLSFPDRFSGSKKSELWIQYLQISLGMILHADFDRWCKTECCLRLVTNFVHRHFTGLDIWRHGCRVHRRRGKMPTKILKRDTFASMNLQMFYLI